LLHIFVRFRLLINQSKKAEEAALTFKAERKTRPSAETLAAYNDFCQMPETLINKNIILSGMGQRLLKMDKICQITLQNFR
jgi:hypothetical protein